MNTKKQINLSLLLAFLAETVIVHIIIAPIYTMVSSDILFKNSYLSEILYYLSQLLMYALYPTVFSLIIYSVYKFSLPGNKSTLLIPLAMTFFKYSLTFTIDCIVNSYHSSMLASAIVYALIDIVELCAVSLIAEFTVTKKREAERIKFKAQKALGEEQGESEILPIRSLADIKNPIVVSAFSASAIMGGIKILARIRYDLTEPIYGISDIVDMVLYYLLDVGTIFITYLIIVYLISSFLPKEKSN